MIDLTSETLISFSEASEHVPGRPHISTIHRWRLHGVRGVRLETALVGGKRFTSIEAIERFVSRITNAAEGEATIARTPRQREQAIRRAEKELAAEGV